MSDIDNAVNRMPSLDTARSFLFAPGGDARKLARALESGADAVIADLEDAVLAGEKERARDLVAGVMADARDAGCLRLVRVNGADTGWFADDVAMLADLALDGVVLPKATGDPAGRLRTSLPVVAIVETAAGLHGAAAVAAGSAALMLGAVDLALELRLEPRADGLELLHARSSVVLAAALHRQRGPIDRVWVDVRDDAGLAQDCAVGRSLGFRGKACIHPDQVAVVNEAYAPSDAELDHARDVIDAYERAAAHGEGAVALHGEMIDLPVVERARALLAESTRSVLHGE